MLTFALLKSTITNAVAPTIPDQKHRFDTFRQATLTYLNTVDTLPDNYYREGAFEGILEAWDDGCNCITATTATTGVAGAGGHSG